MNGTTPLKTPRMIYDWKEERKRNLECHLRISVSFRPLELWGGFGNRPEFSKINAQLFVSGVCVKSGTYHTIWYHGNVWVLYTTGYVHS